MVFCNICAKKILSIDFILSLEKGHFMTKTGPFHTHIWHGASCPLPLIVNELDHFSCLAEQYLAPFPEHHQL